MTARRLRTRTPARSPTPLNSTVARSAPRCSCAVPIAAQRSGLPAMPTSASPVTAVLPSALRQRRPRALIANRSEALARSRRLAVPLAVTRPSNTSSTSGRSCKTRSSRRSFDGCRTALSSPCCTLPRRLALPPMPLATRLNASGVEASSLPVSNAISSAVVLARKFQRGDSLLPRKTSVARRGAGTRPPTATSIRDRSPCTLRPMRGAVSPAAAGNTAVASRSVRKSSRGA